MIVTALVVLAGTVGLGTIQAQQPAAAGAAQVTTQAGPRMAAPLRRYEAQVPQPANKPAYLASADLNDTHTLTFTTLGLILAAIIAILLLA
jgi:hypothetical protein